MYIYYAHAREGKLSTSRAGGEMAVDWVKIRAEYEAGGISYRKLAAKYKVNLSTLSVRAKREGWVKSKQKTQDKILTKTIQKTITKIVNRNERHLALADKALDAIEEYFRNKHYKRHVTKVKRCNKKGELIEELKAVKLPVADTAALAHIVRALQRMQATQRLAEGLDLDLDKERQALEREKLNLLRQKLSSGNAITDVIAANNDRIMRLADLINNPVPDRRIQDFEDDE